MIQKNSVNHGVHGENNSKGKTQKAKFKNKSGNPAGRIVLPLVFNFCFGLSPVFPVRPVVQMPFL